MTPIYPPGRAPPTRAEGNAARTPPAPSPDAAIVTEDDRSGTGSPLIDRHDGPGSTHARTIGQPGGKGQACYPTSAAAFGRAEGRGDGYGVERAAVRRGARTPGTRGGPRVHGFGGSPRSVQELALRLADEGYSVALPLLTGHGLAPEAMESSRWTDWTADVERAYEWLEGANGRRIPLRPVDGGHAGFCGWPLVIRR